MITKKRRLPKLSEKVKNVLKWAFYAFFALILFSLSTSGNPEASKGLVLIPFALAIACFNSEMTSAIVGGVFGMLVDISCDKVLGFTALYLCLLCGICTAMFRQLLRKNFLNYLIAVVLCCGIYLYLDYAFFYQIWGFSGYETVLSEKLLPSCLKTVAWSPLTFIIVFVSELLSKNKRELSLEGDNANIDRI